jgi:sortase A
MKMPRRRLLRVVEITCWALGLAGLVGLSAFQIALHSGTRRDLHRFSALQLAIPGVAPDQSLWSRERIAAWRKAVTDSAPAPLAVLRIPRLHLEVPVLPGTDDRTLDRAVGHVDDTAAPGADGNSAIAGHRDGFFRGLKDITTGDLIEVETHRGRQLYRVERTWVVAPEDVWVLDPTASSSLTLITCYPFYFVGPAPQRFIVRAVQVPEVNRTASRKGV